MKKLFFAVGVIAMALTAFACASQPKESKELKAIKAEIKEVVFHVNLHCNSCVKKVQENISFEKGVKGLEVSLEKQTVVVKYDAAKTSVETLKAAIQKLNVPVKSVEFPKGE